MRAPLILVLLSLGAVACGTEAPGERTAERAAAIADGERDTQHEAVFALLSHEEGGVGVCSSTLIAKNLLLTARHCVAPSVVQDIQCGESPFSDPLDPAVIFATNSAEIADDSIWFQAGSVHVPPDGNDTCGFDIALVVLAGSGLPEDTAAPLVPRIDRPVRSGEQYSAIGYGLTGDTRGATVGSRMRLDGLEARCSPGGCGFGVEDSEFRGEAGICEGDSGGPALDSEDRVIGVASRGTAGCDNPVYSSVASWSDWIRGVAEQAAADGGYTPPAWVTSGSSEPESGGAGAGGGAAAVQGQACGEDAPCGDGFACYFEVDPKDAYCAARCDADNACDAGLTCDTALGVCVEPSGGGDAPGGGGCAVGGSQGRGSGDRLGPWLLLGLVLIRRFRRSGRMAANEFSC